MRKSNSGTGQSPSKVIHNIEPLYIFLSCTILSIVSLIVQRGIVSVSLKPFNPAIRRDQDPQGRVAQYHLCEHGRPFDLLDEVKCKKLTDYSVSFLLGGTCGSGQRRQMSLVGLCCPHVSLHNQGWSILSVFLNHVSTCQIDEKWNMCRLERKP